ncbi:ACP phosphodiesterase [Shimwellia blattae]|uniref:Acyl carrier protein phosphodiesterase n=1 Tax=Shimwellia blattae (strain ATCC 29907 / DSM 4481 / JCM 1650 / NBRC 105725 / CDC 9005-74) TaxID=630626 RepID=I2BBT4_SHIBC|nr:ACP phosphodiesterase [Shimwellia blattae]AFJ47988.1 acyl carrier protein phosphodiesterase [Shimwellia blattae DSM 4481 = NBRC 105725]GAB82826.1 acyl carrier protein phosphodiesterase [Shimwellia blattae DSM 4481 = NBRC 105725]VDY65488.1 acyl carrier protein phosphodiesterase [Shimwellia blattae]VEC24745.1 acyl carrier protein phosphodiesterase [Shimwellia blattae]
MNFLAHLHLASLANSSLLGNILADFVRGNPETHWQPDVVSGIYLHRRIDVLTDNLPEVRTARALFRPDTRRVAPITLDVMWDHFISRHWQQLSAQQSLADFVRQARAEIVPALPGTPPSFIQLNNAMWSEHWLERYRDMDFIARALNGMASRRPRLAALSDSWQDLDNHYSELEHLFWDFYPQMMARAGKQQL